MFIGVDGLDSMFLSYPSFFYLELVGLWPIADGFFYLSSWLCFIREFLEMINSFIQKWLLVVLEAPWSLLPTIVNGQKKRHLDGFILPYFGFYVLYILYELVGHLHIYYSLIAGIYPRQTRHIAQNSARACKRWIVWTHVGYYLEPTVAYCRAYPSLLSATSAPTCVRNTGHNNRAFLNDISFLLLDPSSSAANTKQQQG